jgi:protein-disulfide isomerase
MANQLVFWTGIAVIVGAVAIGAAVVLSRPQSYSASDFVSPSVSTPSTIPSNGHTLGQPNAPVTLVVYSDFRCTGCAAFYRGQEPQLIDNYVATGKLKILYQDYTLIDQIDASQGIQTSASLDAANAGLCAADENAFWKYHDWLFTNQSPTEDPSAFTVDRLIGIAKAAGIDDPTFEACVREGKHDSDVATEMSSAPSKINSTPTLFVNGKLVTSSLGGNYQPTYADIATVIDAALATPSPSAGS